MVNLYLLGGYDLEMQAIKQLLLDYQNNDKDSIEIVDLQLGWGAKISAYKAYLDKTKSYANIYGIELIEDIKPPDNYIAIDHHNELAHLPAAIIQIAVLLNVELNRWQQLVAANDSAYIPAMLAMDATTQEIEAIRKADRKAQGVSEADEAQAIIDVENGYWQKDVFVVETTLKRFSPIADRIWQTAEKIIFNETDINYYGHNKNLLVAAFADMIAENKAYHGGGDNGYFGFCDYLEDSTFYVKKIIEIVAKIFSYHTFLFPFKWDIEKPTDLVKESLKKAGWQYSYYNKFNNPLDYNEYHYFYPKVRDILYDYGEEKQNLIRHFSMDVDDESTYKIEITDKASKRSENAIYRLIIKSIDLNVYSSGVGVLSFQLANNSYEDEIDILLINQFGRRIYPPFLGNEFLKDVQENELAKEISITILNPNCNEGKSTDKYKTYTSNFFNNYGDLKKLNEKNQNIAQPKKIVLPQFITAFLPYGYKELGIEPILDDRMFVVCWLGGKDNLLQRVSTNNGYLSDDFWYKYLFVDVHEKTCWDEEMQASHIKKHTYSRWVNYKLEGSHSPTLFGISGYSFVVLSSPFHPFALNHTKTMYYKMIELCLVQRASVLNFSERVSSITKNLNDLKKSNKDQEKLKIEKLHLTYLHFINKFYFREVTPQEQGIDLYNKMQNIFRIPEQVQGLDAELSELYQFSSNLEAQKQTKEANWLSKIAILFIPASLLIAFLDFKDWDESIDIVKDTHIDTLALKFILICTIAILSMIYIKQKNK